MAQIRKKGKKELPPISTASLPDIIFILLFFFMVVTVMRETELKVKNRLPQATELTKLERKSLVRFVYMGAPTLKYQERLGTAPRIQLNDQFAKVEDIGGFVENERNTIEENLKSAMTIALRIDKEVKMGIITDVKTELRKANALKINYSSRQKEEKQGS
jgi:biopolymer transport protein ExbD